MTQQIRFMWDSWVRAVIRYWDNKFIRSNEVEYLRSQIELERSRYEKLVHLINAPRVASDDSFETEDEWKPINVGFKPLHVKRQEMEMISRSKAFALKQEAEKAIEKNKTTEQLEAELGIEH